jgi:hypothetical protein
MMSFIGLFGSGKEREDQVSPPSSVPHTCPVPKAPPKQARTMWLSFGWMAMPVQVK